MKDQKNLYSSPQAYSAHQILFLYMVSDTVKPDFDKTCQILRDTQQLDTPNPQTGATLLGIATALLLEEAVLSLLNYGADINHPTGLIYEERNLPFTIALKRTTASFPSSLFPPLSIVPDKLRPATDEKKSIKKRVRILEYFLQHPRLNLRLREASSTGLGNTVLDWVEDLINTKLPAIDSLKGEQKLFLERLHHRASYGLDDLRKAYNVFGGTMQGLFNFNKVKPFDHDSDYIRFAGSSLVIMKTMEKPGSTFSPEDVKLVRWQGSEEKDISIHQQVWRDTNKYKDIYHIYEADKQFWACGRFEKSELSIVSISSKLKIHLTPSKNLPLVQDIQSRLLYARCKREVMAMEWHRLFNPLQPQYEVVVGNTMATAAVVVTLIPKTWDLKQAYGNKTTIPYLTGLADVLCDILITNDVDPNSQNFLVKNNAIIHIDGDRCWARLREYTPTDRFTISQSITELLKQKSLGQNGCYFWNFFDKIHGGKVQKKSPFYDWLLSMVKTPQFKQDLQVALLKRIFLPDSFIDAFVSYYIPSPSEPITLQQQLSLRLKEVREAALENPEFRSYLQTPKAQQDMENFLKNLVSFKIYNYTYLCSLEDKNIVEIRKNLYAQVPESKKISDKVGPALLGDSKSFDALTSICRKITSQQPEAEIIQDIHLLNLANENLNRIELETGATLLGIAMTLLMPKVVEELLRAGADPNLPPNLKNKQWLLPLTIMVGKQHVSQIESLYRNPSQAPSSQNLHDDKKCDCATRRLKVIVALLSDPRLEIGKTDHNKKTVFTKWPNLQVIDPLLYKALIEGEQKKSPLVAAKLLTESLSSSAPAPKELKKEVNEKWIFPIPKKEPLSVPSEEKKIQWVPTALPVINAQLILESAFASILDPKELKEIKQELKNSDTAIRLIHISPEVVSKLLEMETSTTTRDEWSQSSLEQRVEILSKLLSSYFNISLDSIKSIGYFKYYGYEVRIVNSAFNIIAEAKAKVKSVSLFGSPVVYNSPVTTFILNSINVLESSSYQGNDLIEINNFVKQFHQKFKEKFVTASSPEYAYKIAESFLLDQQNLLVSIHPKLKDIYTKDNVRKTHANMENLRLSIASLRDGLSTKSISLALETLPPPPSKIGSGYSHYSPFP